MQPSRWGRWVTERVLHIFCRFAFGKRPSWLNNKNGYFFCLSVFVFVWFGRQTLLEWRRTDRADVPNSDEKGTFSSGVRPLSSRFMGWFTLFARNFVGKWKRRLLCQTAGLPFCDEVLWTWWLWDYCLFAVAVARSGAIGQTRCIDDKFIGSFGGRRSCPICRLNHRHCTVVHWHFLSFGDI